MAKKKKDEVKLEVDRDLLLALIRKVEEVAESMRKLEAERERIDAKLLEEIMSTPGEIAPISPSSNPQNPLFVVGIVGLNKIPERRLKQFREELKELLARYGVLQVSASFLATNLS